MVMVLILYYEEYVISVDLFLPILDVTKRVRQLRATLRVTPFSATLVAHGVTTNGIGNGIAGVCRETCLVPA